MSTEMEPVSVTIGSLETIEWPDPRNSGKWLGTGFDIPRKGKHTWDTSILMISPCETCPMVTTIDDKQAGDLHRWNSLQDRPKQYLLLHSGEIADVVFASPLRDAAWGCV